VLSISTLSPQLKLNLESNKRRKCSIIIAILRLLRKNFVCLSFLKALKSQVLSDVWIKLAIIGKNCQGSNKPKHSSTEHLYLSIIMCHPFSGCCFVCTRWYNFIVVFTIVFPRLFLLRNKITENCWDSSRNMNKICL